jgi:MFS transporter, FSR family, fosmidomycin resistance protein
MHVVNDGLFAGTYPLLPLVAAELGLSYAQVGALKTAYSGASSVLQVPAGMLAERMGEQLLLALGTAWVGLGLLLVALTGSYLPLLVANVVAGIGGNVQHPVASAIVSRVFDSGRRATAIGTLNFAGDVGKVLAPLIVGIAAATGGWRSGFLALGAIGAVFALGYALVVPEPIAASPPGAPTGSPDRAPGAEPEAAALATGTPRSRWGIRAPGTFAALIGIGMLDAAARGTALVFIPFVLQGKGAEAASMSFYFAALFAAGAAGKFLCGPLGDRFGSAAVIAVTELITAAALVGLVGAPLELTLLALLPLGFMLNGTSSVLYASVASLIHASRRARGYGLYYTCSQVSSAASPLLYGLVADWFGLTTAIVALAIATAAIVPLALLVGPRLRDN